MRSAENDGNDPAALLTTVVNARELRTARSISETLAWRISRYATPPPATSELAEPSQPVQLPPWITAPPAGEPTAIARYLRDAAALITERCEHVADDAISCRPRWMALLGEPPGERDRHHEWQRHVLVIAAYRDQYQITTDDPLQVLGPYTEPGHAGHRAYWQAAESVLAARHAAGLEDRDGAPSPVNTARTRIAIATYNGLPADERETVSAILAERLQPLWFGDRHNHDGDAAAKPCYAGHLAAVLTERRHLSASLHTASPQRRTSQQPLEAQFARRRQGSGLKPGTARGREPLSVSLAAAPARSTPGSVRKAAIRPR